MRFLREQRGLSLAELARQAGLAKQTLSNLEQGTGNPTVDTLFAIAAALGVPVTRLVAERKEALKPRPDQPDRLRAKIHYADHGRMTIGVHDPGARHEYPMLDDRTVLRRAPRESDIYTWTPASNRFAWTAYLGRPPQEEDDRPYVSAARRADPTGLPPTWIGVGDLDLFCSENVEYARRLREAGVACESRVEPGMYHGADALFDGKAASIAAFRIAMLDALRTARIEP